MKELHILVQALNKIENEPVDGIFGACNELLRKLTYAFFGIIDEGTASLGNGNLFNAIIEEATLIKTFGPTYIDFDEYPPNSGTISEEVVANFNAHIQCYHGYPHS